MNLRRPRASSMRAKITLLAALLIAIPAAACALFLAKYAKARLVEDVIAKATYVTPDYMAPCWEVSAGIIQHPRDDRLTACPPESRKMGVAEVDKSREPVLRLSPLADDRDAYLPMLRKVYVGDQLQPQGVTPYSLPLGNEQDTLRRIVFACAGGTVLLIGIGTLATWILARRILRPLALLRARMAKVAEGNPDIVELPRSSKEIVDLANVMNDTLDRMRAAVEVQQRFVADASHELRGPIAAVRAELEIALVHSNESSWPDVVTRALSDTERLQQLATDLLLLSRLDTARFQHGEVVDLAGLCREQVVLRRPPRDLALICEIGADAVHVRGREQLLGRLLGNLVENAERYAGGTIVVSLTTAMDLAVLEVVDDGPGIPKSGLDIVFERFTRLDSARSRETGGSGLGLAIARGIATAHGGTLHAVETISGAHFIARIPLCRED